MAASIGSAGNGRNVASRTMLIRNVRSGCLVGSRGFGSHARYDKEEDNHVVGGVCCGRH